MKQQELLGADHLLHLPQRYAQHVPFPFLLPDRFQLGYGLIRHPLERRCSGGGIGTASKRLSSRRPFSELVADAPARDLQKPAFERTERWVGFELPHFFGYANDRLLHHIL